MSCENVVVSMSTVKASGLLQVDAKTPPYRKEEINLCMFTLDADCRESQVNKEALLQESARQKDMSFRENEFPSSSSLCGHALVKTRNNSTKRAASLDFLENVLPYEHFAQLGCKSGCKSFWKNLRFWLRTKKTAGSCGSVASSAQHASKFLPLNRCPRIPSGPLYLP